MELPLFSEVTEARQRASKLVKLEVRKQLTKVIHEIESCMADVVDGVLIEALMPKRDCQSFGDASSISPEQSFIAAFRKSNGVSSKDGARRYSTPAGTTAATGLPDSKVSALISSVCSQASAASGDSARSRHPPRPPPVQLLQAQPRPQQSQLRPQQQPQQQQPQQQQQLEQQLEQQPQQQQQQPLEQQPCQNGGNKALITKGEGVDAKLQAFEEAASKLGFAHHQQHVRSRHRSVEPASRTLLSLWQGDNTARDDLPEERQSQLHPSRQQQQQQEQEHNQDQTRAVEGKPPPEPLHHQQGLHAALDQVLAQARPPQTGPPPPPRRLSASSTSSAVARGESRNPSLASSGVGEPIQKICRTDTLASTYAHSQVPNLTDSVGTDKSSIALRTGRSRSEFQCSAAKFGESREQSVAGSSCAGSPKRGSRRDHYGDVGAEMARDDVSNADVSAPSTRGAAAAWNDLGDEAVVIDLRSMPPDVAAGAPSQAVPKEMLASFHSSSFVLDVSVGNSSSSEQAPMATLDSPFHAAEARRSSSHPEAESGAPARQLSENDGVDRQNSEESASPTTCPSRVRSRIYKRPTE